MGGRVPECRRQEIKQRVADGPLAPMPARLRESQRQVVVPGGRLWKDERLALDALLRKRAWATVWSVDVAAAWLLDVAALTRRRDTAKEGGGGGRLGRRQLDADLFHVVGTEDKRRDEDRILLGRRRRS